MKVFWNSEMAYLARLSPMDGPQPRAKGPKTIAHSPLPKKWNIFWGFFFLLFCRPFQYIFGGLKNLVLDQFLGNKPQTINPENQKLGERESPNNGACPPESLQNDVWENFRENLFLSSRPDRSRNVSVKVRDIGYIKVLDQMKKKQFIWVSMYLARKY